MKGLFRSCIFALLTISVSMETKALAGEVDFDQLQPYSQVAAYEKYTSIMIVAYQVDEDGHVIKGSTRYIIERVFGNFGGSIFAYRLSQVLESSNEVIGEALYVPPMTGRPKVFHRGKENEFSGWVYTHNRQYEYILGLPSPGEYFYFRSSNGKDIVLIQTDWLTGKVKLFIRQHVQANLNTTKNGRAVVFKTGWIVT